jgi:predicted TIM-barrel fold metal-dependent hydrolase
MPASAGHASVERLLLVLSFQEDAIGIRPRDLIGVDNLMWGSDYPHNESRKILKGDAARLTVPA